MKMSRWTAAITAAAVAATPGSALAVAVAPIDGQYDEPVAGVVDPPEAPAQPEIPAEPNQPATPQQPDTPSNPPEATLGAIDQPDVAEPAFVQMPAGLGTLPFTGAELALLGAAGLVFAASGVALRRAAR